MRRPKWETVEDIGSWYASFRDASLSDDVGTVQPFLIGITAEVCTVDERVGEQAAASLSDVATSASAVLTFLGFAAVMVNSTMVAFVGSKHATLGDRGLADTTEDDAESLLAEEMGGFKARIQNWNLWLFAVGIEHAMLMLRVLVLALFPDDPDWLDEAREVLEYRLDDQKDVEAMEVQKELHAEFLDKLDGYDEADRAPMEHLTTRTLRAHMNEKKAGKAEEDRAAATKKTAVKVINPLQQGFENPLSGNVTDSSDEEESEEEDAKGMD